MRLIFGLFLLCLPACLWADRVALVIGNTGYQNVPRLDNPINDSIAVSAALAEQGFEVLTGNNLGRVEMRDTLRQFRDMADRSDVALVYYAGHGIEIGGVNYLVPIDARLEDERDAGLEMIDLDLILRQISGASQVKMVVLDACRNNPFVTRMRSSGQSRSVGLGLGDIRTNQADTLVAYAAAAGAVTPDGDVGENSPFTTAFLAAMAEPPADVRRMLGRVRDRMRDTVPGAAPFVYSSLGGGEYIVNPNSARLEPAPRPVVANPDGSISRDFVRIDRNGTVEDWDRFLVKYEDQSSHPLYAFALEKREAVMAAKPVPSAPAPEPASRIANLAPDGAATPNTPVVPVFIAPQLPDPGSLARSIQIVLKENGCYRGRIDGDLGRGSRRGLAEFSKRAGVQIDLGRSPDAVRLNDTLTTLRAYPGVTCPAPQPVARAPVTSRRKSVAPEPASKPTTAKKDRASTNVQGLYTRSDATKKMPDAPSDCLGTGAKWYDCD